MYHLILLEQVAARFKVLAEPMRLRLLQALRPGEQTVSALVKVMGASQANLSKHLAVLHRDGLVTRRREGLNVYYRIAEPSVFRLCDLVCGRIERRAEHQAARTVRAGRRRTS